MKAITRACLVSVVVTSAVSAAAQQPRNPEEYARFLEGAARVARMQVPRVVQALQVRPGVTVADIGSGSGLFSRPIARAVAPGGIVYAVDVDEGLLKVVARTSADEKIANIRTVLATPDDPKLPEAVDVAFICDTLHHIAQPAAYLKTLKKYLKPGGRIVVIDFAGTWPEGHESMRYTEEELDGWMRAAGLTRAGSHDWLENSFFVVYR